LPLLPVIAFGKPGWLLNIFGGVAEDAEGVGPIAGGQPRFQLEVFEEEFFFRQLFPDAL